MANTFNDFYERLKKKKEAPLLIKGENEEEDNIQFLVREKIMSSDSHEKKGIKIELYDYAILKNEDYPLTTPAGKPHLVTRYVYVTLTVK